MQLGSEQGTGRAGPAPPPPQKDPPLSIPAWSQSLAAARHGGARKHLGLRWAPQVQAWQQQLRSSPLARPTWAAP